ncbi:sulfite exporter TauE/SafE family protein [bacterium]|nr:sulfite exporter TauE/SafE family protein [bacterium]
MIDLLVIIFPDWSEFLLVNLVFCLSEIVYVAFGFGAGLLCIGLLALVVSNIQDVVVILLLVNLPVELVVVWRSKQNLRWQGLLRILVGLGLGIVLGTWLLSFGTPILLLGLLGIVLLVIGISFLVAPKLKPRSVSLWWEPIIGMLSGILAGMFSTGGPPLIYYYQSIGSKKSIFRGNLMAIFLVMSLIRVPLYSVVGLISLPRLSASFAIMPAVLLGAIIGNKIHLEIGEILFRRLVGIILAIIGLILLGRL